MLSFVFLVTVWSAVVFAGESVLETRSLDEIIRYINEESKTTWKAARSSRFQNIDDLKKLSGALNEDPVLRKQRRPTVSHNQNLPLPETFDARKNWPMCKSIGEIRDQSGCGSCWAFGATEAMTDRLCIHSGGKVTKQISACDLLSCCGKKCGNGCEGGFLGPAWDYWKTAGIVTGGSLEKPTGCRPYPFPACDHTGKSKRYTTCPELDKEKYTPKCMDTCQDGYEKSFEQDKTYARTSYNVPDNEEDIMREILTNGPVEAKFRVYTDIGLYESGIYQHVAGDYVGYHAIKILGWGTENDTPYWLIANSWNEEWGENGLFRFLRGKNECQIEDSVVAGMPRV